VNLPWLNSKQIEGTIAGAREVDLEPTRPSADNFDISSEDEDENLEQTKGRSLTFGWLEKKVLLHSPVADAVISKFRKARCDEQRLRLVDNIETWNEYFNTGNKDALNIDMLQLLSQHRYAYMNSGEKLEERMHAARSEELFWKNMTRSCDDYGTFLEKNGDEMLLLLECANAGENAGAGR